MYEESTLFQVKACCETYVMISEGVYRYYGSYTDYIALRGNLDNYKWYRFVLRWRKIRVSFFKKNGQLCIPLQVK